MSESPACRAPWSWLPSLLALGLTACAQSSGAPAQSAVGQAPAAEAGAAGQPEPGSSAAEERPARAGTAPLAAGAPLPAGEEPTPEKALPELRVEALGMHVGGGTNSPEEKAPFHRALERQFPAFMECYRLADDAWAGGSFGVDLKIPRAGGGPTLEQPRTKIRGAGFQDCMLGALSRVQFEKPKAGPTVLSYSVRFTLGKGKASR